MNPEIDATPATQALIALLRRWPRRHVSARLLNHAEPEEYLLSGALEVSLPRDRQRKPAFAARPSRSMMVGFFDQGFPELLRQIPDPPLVLYCQGNEALLGEPAVAVVGARRCTSQGRRNAQSLALDLVSQGLHVVSGLALGIDGAAHRGTLGVDAQGRTIAILGGGIQRLYPRRHLDLAQQILSQGGLLVSEYADQLPPLAHQFPERNRIISGLCMATVVVEAGVNSGSLITARLAAEQGRDVYAMPGPVSNAMSKGCHQLIQQGAGLVASGVDVVLSLGLEALGGEITAPNPVDKLSVEAASVLSHIQGYAISMDELLLATGLQPGTLTGILVGLEIAGFVQQQPLGYIRTF